MHNKFAILDITFFYLRRIGPVLKQNIMSRIVRCLQPVGYLCFILTYFNISRNRSQLLCKKCIDKFCKLHHQKTLCWSPLLTSCRPKACNCINIKNPAQELFSNFCEISQNNLLQNNREWLLLLVERYNGKIYSRNQ